MSIALSGHKSKAKAGGTEFKTTMEEIEDESWEEQRHHPKAKSHVLFHINDKESADSDVVKGKLPLMKYPTAPIINSARKVDIEEVEDEAWEVHCKKPKSPKHLLEALDNLDDCQTLQNASTDDMSITPDSSMQKQAMNMEIGTGNQDKPEIQIPRVSPPLPPKDKPYHLQKKCFTPAGTSVLGVSVLSTRGWVSNLENVEVDL